MSLLWIKCSCKTLGIGKEQLIQEDFIRVAERTGAPVMFKALCWILEKKEEVSKRRQKKEKKIEKKAERDGFLFFFFF